MKKETDADQIDFNKKILHMSWHPFEDSIAIAATNNVSLLLCRKVMTDHIQAVCLFGIVRLPCLPVIGNVVVIEAQAHLVYLQISSAELGGILDVQEIE